MQREITVGGKNLCHLIRALLLSYQIYRQFIARSSGRFSEDFWTLHTYMKFDTYFRCRGPWYFGWNLVLWISSLCLVFIEWIWSMLANGRDCILVWDDITDHSAMSRTRQNIKICLYLFNGNGSFDAILNVSSRIFSSIFFKCKI